MFGSLIILIIVLHIAAFPLVLKAHFTANELHEMSIYLPGFDGVPESDDTGNLPVAIKSEKAPACGVPASASRFVIRQLPATNSSLWNNPWQSSLISSLS